MRGTGSRGSIRPAFVLLAVLAALVLGIGGAEAYLRLTLHPPPAPEAHVFVHAPLAALRVSVTRDLPGLTTRSVVFHSNALGLRGDEIDLTRSDGLRILAFGDSITECLLLADGDAWPHRLQEMLSAKTGRRVWVGNAGRSGQLVFDYIVHTRVLAPTVRPDILIVMPGGYELQSAIEEKFLPMDLSDAALLADHARKLYVDANVRGLEPSYLGFVLSRHWNPQDLDMTAYYDRMKRRRSATPKRDEFRDLDDALDVYEAGLRALVASSRTLQPRPRLVLVTSPSLWRPDLSEKEQATLWGGYTCMDCRDPEYLSHAALARSIRRFNETLLAVCAEEQLKCLDLEGKIDRTLDNFYDDAHMSASGARQVASHLADFLVANQFAD